MLSFFVELASAPRVLPTAEGLPEEGAEHGVQDRVVGGLVLEACVLHCVLLYTSREDRDRNKSLFCCLKCQKDRERRTTVYCKWRPRRLNKRQVPETSLSSLPAAHTKIKTLCASNYL